MTSPGSLNMMEPVEEGSIKALVQTYETFKVLDREKATFFDNAIQRLQLLSIRLAKERAEREMERAYLQQRIDSFGNNGERTSSSSSSSSSELPLEPIPHVLVLIDGNELIFQTKFLGQGDKGGRHAAQALFRAVHEYAFSTIVELPIAIKVVVRIWVDLEDLCSISLRAGLVNHSSQVKAFVRGFCQDKPFFDLIDVGMQGRETVFDKMEANLNMNIVDTNCKHILFGCEDGEIYAPMLRTFIDETETKSRITLLHGTPPDSRLVALRLAGTEMNHIFRNTKVNSHRLVEQAPDANSVPALLKDSVSPPPSSSPTTSRSGSRTAIGAARSAVRELHSRQVSDSSNQSFDVSAVPATPKVLASSWAMAAKKGAAVKALPKDLAKEKVQLSADGIGRNRKGQRIDPPTPEFKKDEVNRLKKLKLCNAFHLRHDWPYPDGKCEHDHFYKCTSKELETLKLVARMSACVHGSECSDPKCIYGHRCPFPNSKESGFRKKACINGDNCRFPVEMHNMDITPVRRLRIT